MPFKKGETANPKGRPLGSRHRFAEAFWLSIADEWAHGGNEAMRAVRQTDPATFVRVAASLIPKETTVTLKSELDTMTDAELRDFIRAELEASSGGGEAPASPASTGVTH